jgi:ribosomal protein S12 methylthiotransferase
LKKPIHKIRVGIITLGCPKNAVDSEFLAAKFPEEVYDVVHEPQDETDIIIINTCGFIGDAKQQSIDVILEASEAKARNPQLKVLITGCMAERYLKELKQEFPEADGVFGIAESNELVASLGIATKSDYGLGRKLTTPKHFAYLKIAEGCNRRCSFCAIPGIRGPYHSVTQEKLIEEASLLAASGVKELILIAQDTTFYGYDLGKKKEISSLLRKLCRIDGIEWIRIMYTYPGGFPMSLLQVMAEESKVCAYLDIPVQHVSARILKDMRRGGDKIFLEKLIGKIRSAVPKIALRTSIIAGFPGETKKEFNELCDFVKEIEFERLGVFSYSHEEGTPAHRFRDNIGPNEKLRRVDQIMEIQQGISLKNNNRFLEKKIPVIIDAIESGMCKGRSEYDAPEIDNLVHFPAVEKHVVGDIVQVIINGADAYDLYGKTE